MPYRFATENQDFSDYSSGRVLYNLPGAPAFPIRLASEIFERARSHLRLNRRLALYDPTCGGAYHLTALGFLYPDAIQSILASDADARALALAQRNLGLLTPQGLDQREREITAMLNEYGKESHSAALQSTAALRARLDPSAPIHTRCFLANALDSASMTLEVGKESVDLVMCDVPYGRLSDWILPETQPPDDLPPVSRLLGALYSILAPEAVVAIAADKSQQIAHPGFRRVERFQIGKRQVVLLQISTA